MGTVAWADSLAGTAYTATAYPSRRGSAAPVITPVAGSTATACMPPTFMVQSSERLRVMAARFQRGDDIRRDAALDLHELPVPQPRARRLDRILQRQTEIEILHIGLRLGLQDAVAAGRAEREHRLSVQRRDRRRHADRQFGAGRGAVRRSSD